MTNEERFIVALQETLNFEGGFSNHPDDRGGATNYGVTQGAWDDYCQKKGYPLTSVRFLSKTDVQEFYKSEYWNTCNLDLVEDLYVCMEVFDSSVLHGPSRAVKFLQRAINFLLPKAAPLLVVDGDLGPKTRNTLQSLLTAQPRLHLLLCTNAEQYRFLSDLALRDPKQRSFTRGWVKRLRLVEGV